MTNMLSTEPEENDVCEWCEERTVYKRGLCYECYQAGLEDEAERRFEDERCEEAQGKF